MKKFLCALLVFTMLCACALADYNPLINMESTLPVTNEPYTLTAVSTYSSAINVDFDKYQTFWKWKEKYSNVHVEWNLIVSDAWNEQKAIILASGDLPDIFFKGFDNTDMVKFAMDQGLFLPLNEYLDDEELTPQINQVFKENPNLKAASTLPDGNIYGLGYYMTEYYETASGIRALWIKQYPDSVGVDVTNIVTLDDLYDTLLKLRGVDWNGNGVDDEIPVGFYSSPDTIPAWNNLLEYVMNAYGIVYTGDKAVNTRTGKAGYAPLTEEFRKTLEYWNKLYAEQLLDNDTFIQSEAEFQAKGANGQYALSLYGNPGAIVPSDISAAHTANDYKNEIEYFPVPVVDEVGNTPVANGDYGIGLNRVSLSKDCKDPDIAMRYLDSFFEPLCNLYFRAGPEMGTEPDILEGMGFEYNPETTDTSGAKINEWSKENTGWSGYYMWIGVVNFAMDSVGYLGADDYRGLKTIHPDMLTAGARAWTAPYEENINPYERLGFPSFAVYYTEDQMEFLEDYEVDLNMYAYSNAAKFITGDKSFDEYEDYIAGLKKLHADEYDQMISDIYDAFVAAM